MKLLKPSWLVHSDQHRSYEVYTVNVSPDGKRLASGGLDGKVRIWSTAAITNCLKSNKKLAKSAQLNPLADHRQLCSMSTHTGAVTVVRFSPCGRYLASGSDDRVVLIWELDETRAPQPEFGSNISDTSQSSSVGGLLGMGGMGIGSSSQPNNSEQNSETWVARKRLIGHDNDVQDLAWAPDSSILVTVGLDSSIIIWSGTTFERLKRFDIHQSHVKGVAFDPANKYFATASDDRTLKIIRYHHTSSNEVSFSVEATVSAPFKGSPLSTYYRRCSWSPDGNHIAVANATNLPLATVAMINRGTWESDISLVGHDAPCEVASFCPRMFCLDQNAVEEFDTPSNQNPNTSMNGNNNNSTGGANSESPNNTNTNNKPPPDYKSLASVVATAGQDKTLAIWNTASPRPLVVATNIAEKSITDIAWSNDGSTLYASSLDGTILAAVFKPGELGWVVPVEANQLQLIRYGGGKEALQIPASTGILELEEASEAHELEIEKQKEMLRKKKLKEKERILDNIMGSNPSNTSSTFDKKIQEKDGGQKDNEQSKEKGNENEKGTGPENTTLTKIPEQTALQVVKKPAQQPVLAKPIAPTLPTPAPQKITITKDGKKRITPILISGALTATSSARKPSDSASSSSATAGSGGATGSGIGSGMGAGGAGTGRGTIQNQNTVQQAIEYAPAANVLPKGGVSTLLIGTKRRGGLLESSTQGTGISANGTNGPNSANGTTTSATTATTAATSNKKKPHYTEVEFSQAPYMSPASSVSQLRISVPKVKAFFSRTQKSGTLNTNNTTGNETSSLTESTVQSVDSSGNPIAANPPSTDAGPNIIGPNDLEPSVEVQYPAACSVLEVRNSSKDKEPTRVVVTKAGMVIFSDYLPRYAVLAAAGGGENKNERGEGGVESFWAVATEDGALYIYSSSGRRMFPPIVVGAQLSFLESKGNVLIAISAVGMVYVWDILGEGIQNGYQNSLTSINTAAGSSPRAIYPPISLAPVFDSSSTYLDNGIVRMPKLTHVGVTPQGAQPVVTLSNGDSFVYSAQMLVWTRVSESWWASGSQYWDTLAPLSVTRYNNNNNNNNNNSNNSDNYSNSASSTGIINLLEHRTTSECILNNSSRGQFVQTLARHRMLKPGYEGFESLVSVAHLETRLAAARVAQSWNEYRQFARAYANRMGQLGMKERLKELCQEVRLLTEEEDGDGLLGQGILKEVLEIAGKY